MEIKFEKVPSSIDRGISIIIYGNPGSGKTTLASTLPPEETLIITTEAGLGPLLGKGHTLLDLKKVMENNQDKTLEEVVSEIYRMLRTEKHPFKNIVLDNLSELENQLLQDYTHRRKKPHPELKEWGDVSFRMKEWMTLFRDLEYQGLNVIFNAWETQLEIQNYGGEVRTMGVPFIAKRAAVQMCGLVDVVARMEVYEKTGARWLRIGPSNLYLTKTQFQGLAAAEEANLTTLISKIKGYQYVQPVPVTARNVNHQPQEKVNHKQEGP